MLEAVFRNIAKLWLCHAPVGDTPKTHHRLIFESAMTTSVRCPDRVR